MAYKVFPTCLVQICFVPKLNNNNELIAIKLNSGVARNLAWGVQLDNFGIKALFILKFCI